MLLLLCVVCHVRSRALITPTSSTKFSITPTTILQQTNKPMQMQTKTNQQHTDKHTDKQVRVWVHEEEYKGSKLSDAINANGENPKYLPGVKLG